MRPYSKKFRHELKYYITFDEYRILRAKVKSILQLDTNSTSDEGYLIRSLYFDNATDVDLYQKNYGLLKRKKIRVRIYNGSDHTIKLERKNRVGEYISKESLSIRREEYEKLLNKEYDFLLNKNTSLSKDFYFYFRSEVMTPRVIVDYYREAYVGTISDVRITFDKYLSAGLNTIDMFNSEIVTKEALSQPMMIMEVKFNEFLPTYIKHLINLDAHHRSAISKYVICREVLIKSNKV
ncbi:polyphosphate polymerase domain-containing protein [Peribacillus acanthi]|uniref:polyphosphate polymerase domain-containing protein n=1 Tax=Peribacillus acanthi TaxID=2171554 RepID=UPI000D3E9FFB|nr:polyphosphate polymerase domain-containing protein [Peribacillus acanthi]